MPTIWKIAGGAWGAFWAALLVAATVPAKVAVSNLASWADLLGATGLARLLATHGADRLAQLLSIAGLLALPVMAYFALRTYRRIKDDERARHGVFWLLARNHRPFSRNPSEPK